MSTPELGYRPIDQTWWIDPTGETLDKSKLLGPFATKEEAMRLIPLTDARADALDGGQPMTPEREERQRQIAAEMERIANLSEASEPDDSKRGVYVAGDDPAEIAPALTEREERSVDLYLLAMSGQIEPSDAWTVWDWIHLAGPWLVLGLALGAIATTVVNAYT
jgi:ribulose-5-phosphate 4-epimerase/fuculose-1-phosphate aldolase